MLLSPSLDGVADWYIGAKMATEYPGTSWEVHIGGRIARRIRVVLADAENWLWPHGPVFGVTEMSLSACVVQASREWAFPGMLYTLDVPRVVPRVLNVSQTRGTTAGGTHVVIEGIGFNSSDSITVKIAGVACNVLWVYEAQEGTDVGTLLSWPYGANYTTNRTLVACATGSYGPTSAAAPGGGLVELSIGGLGLAAASVDAKYQ